MSNCDKPQEININSECVQTSIMVMQGVINKMTTICWSCKGFCVTLLGALIACSELPDSRCTTAVIFGAITGFFGAADMYYCAIEYQWRDAHDNFISRLHNDEGLHPQDIFNFPRNTSKNIFMAFSKLGIWPFYIMVFTLSLVVTSSKGRAVLGL